MNNFWNGENLGNLLDYILSTWVKLSDEYEGKEVTEDVYGYILDNYKNRKKKESESDENECEIYKVRFFSLPKNINEKVKNEWRILDKCKELFGLELTERAFGQIEKNNYMIMHYPRACEEYSVMFLNKFIKRYNLEEKREEILNKIRLCIIFRIAFGIITISDSSILLRYYSKEGRAEVVSYYETKTKEMGKKRVLPYSVINRWFENKEDYLKFLSKKKNFFKDKKLKVMEVIQQIDQNYMYLYNNFSSFFQF